MDMWMTRARRVKIWTHFTECYTVPLRINSGVFKCVFKRVHMYVSELNRCWTIYICVIA